VTALDLVDGTPVYDIKPCVPWDVPGYHRNSAARRENDEDGRYSEDESSSDDDALVVPDWVEKDDELSGGVHFELAAHTSLVELVKRGNLAPLYTAENDGAKGATEAISQVLAQDPRSSNSNRADRRGTSSSSSSSSSSPPSSSSGSYKMIFCRVEVEFRIDGWGGAVVVDGGDEDRGAPPPSSSSSSRRGGGGRVTVMSVRDSNLDGVERVDGIPVLLK